MVPGTKDTNEFATIAQDKKEFLFTFVLAQGYKCVELQSWWAWSVSRAALSTEGLDGYEALTVSEVKQLCCCSEHLGRELWGSLNRRCNCWAERIAVATSRRWRGMVLDGEVFHVCLRTFSVLSMRYYESYSHFPLSPKLCEWWH